MATEAEPLNLYDRMRRAQMVAAERAKRPATPWKDIAARFGISVSYAKRLRADFQTWDVEPSDPMSVVDQTVAAYDLSLERLAIDYENADATNTNGRLGILRTFTETALGRLELLQSVGRVPRQLGSFRAERELASIAEAMAEVLREADVAPETIRRLREVARPAEVTHLRVAK